MRGVGWVSLGLSLLASGCALQHTMGPHSPCATAGASSDLTWFGPTDSEEGTRIGEWCGVVGAPLVKPVPDGRFEELEDKGLMERATVT